MALLGQRLQVFEIVGEIGGFPSVDDVVDILPRLTAPHLQRERLSQFRAPNDRSLRVGGLRCVAFLLYPSFAPFGTGRSGTARTTAPSSR